MCFYISHSVCAGLQYWNMHGDHGSNYHYNEGSGCNHYDDNTRNKGYYNVNGIRNNNPSSKVSKDSSRMDNIPSTMANAIQCMWEHRCKLQPASLLLLHKWYW